MDPREEGQRRGLFRPPTTIVETRVRGRSAFVARRKNEAKKRVE